VFLTVDPIVDVTNQPYAYAGEDPIDNYDLIGAASSAADAGAAVFVAPAFLMYIAWCTQHPSCSGWGTAAWNIAHGASVDIAALLDPALQAVPDDTKVRDLLPGIPPASRRLIDPRIRDDPDITIGDVNKGMQSGRLPNGQQIGKKRFITAKKLLSGRRRYKK
jgi:hypothetical protein